MVSLKHVTAAWPLVTVIHSGGSPEPTAREAPGHWGAAGLGGLLHPSCTALRVVRIRSSWGADSPADHRGNESLKCRLSQWETSAFDFGGTCAFAESEGPGALTAWPETLGSTRRICGGGFRCLGSGRSVSGNTWCLILTFIRPHTPKPWCQEKANDSPEGRGGRVLGLAAGRGAEGQTHVAEPRENRAPAKRVARTRELRGRHSSDSRTEPASRPRSRPCCLQRDRRHGSSGRVLRSAWDRSPRWLPLSILR